MSGLIGPWHLSSLAALCARGRLTCNEPSTKRGAHSMPKAATAAAQVPCQIVTDVELRQLADLEKGYANAKKLQAAFERRTKAARLALAQKVLGVKTAEEFAALDPEKVDQLMAEREGMKLWKAEKKSPPFVFLKTWNGRQPSWRDEFIKVKSEVEADKITAETPMAYSYRVDVAV